MSKENHTDPVGSQEKKYSSLSENAPPSDKFDLGEMTVPQFIEFLTEKYGVTLNNKPFDLNYAHSVIMTGHMPRHYGGNKLRVRKVRGVKTVKILDEKFSFFDRKKNWEVGANGIKIDLDENGNVKSK